MKDAEKKIVEMRETNRVLRMFVACNRMLLDVKTKAELAREITEIVVEEGGYVMCWMEFPREGDFVPVGYIRDGGPITGQKTSWQKIEEMSGSAVGPSQRVMEVRSENIWGEEVLAHHGKFFVSFLLVWEEERLGIFNIYADTRESLDGERYQLLRDLASGITLVLSLLESRTTKERLQQALEISEEKYLSFLSTHR